MMSVSHRVKKIRENVGLTQEAFAKRLGVERSLISKIEGGRVRLSSSVQSGICDTFAVREEWLVRGHGPVWENRWVLLERRAKELGEDVYEALKACKGTPFESLAHPVKKASQVTEDIPSYGLSREEQAWWLSLWPQIKTRPERLQFVKELLRVWGLQPPPGHGTGRKH